jgi:(p)ppGpp synthase/HD superfamily hydrolase
VHSYAQTNIQLFNQLGRLGYAPAELEAVASAYELAIVLVTGRFRPSGKTFVAHLVGTASILASLAVPSPLVIAGLLHAVYSAGDFGDGPPGVSEARRDRVRSVAGERAEEYVSRYQALFWSDHTIRSITAGLDGMTAMERDVVLMRLANELEEFLDFGILYGGEQKRLAISDRHRCRLMIEIAQRLGFPTLSEELARSIDGSAAAVIPGELLRARTVNASFLLAPQSYQRLKDALSTRLAALGKTKRKQPE